MTRYEDERREAEAIRCPRCRVEPGDRCVYVPPRNELYPLTRDQAAKLGTPTVQAHWERLTDARYRAEQAAKRERAQARRAARDEQD